jgi:hypothetical protein
MHTLRLSPVSESYITQFALEWITAVMADEDIVTINRYPLLKGIQLGTLDRWCKRVPELQETYKHIVDLIGERREHLALHNKINATVFLKGQHMYDKAWQASEEWRANLAAKVNGTANELRIVEMPTFPRVKEVPERKEDV